MSETPVSEALPGEARRGGGLGLRLERRNLLRGAAGLAVGIGALVWGLWGLPLDEVADVVVHANPAWVAPAVVVVVLTTVFKAARWFGLVEAAARPDRPRFGEVYEAMMVGQFLNVVVPLRIGEFVRIGLVGRSGKPGYTATAGTVVVEKGTDLIVTTVLAALVLPVGLGISWSLPAVAVAILGIVLLRLPAVRSAVLAVTGWVTEFLPGRFQPYARRAQVRAIDGLIGITRLRTSALFLAWTAALLVVSILPLGMLLLAVGVDAPLLAWVTLYIVLTLGLIPPSAPGLFGIFTVAARLVLPQFGIAETTAVGYSFLLQAVLVLPIVLIGGWSLAREVGLLWPRDRGATREAAA